MNRKSNNKINFSIPDRTDEVDAGKTDGDGIPDDDRIPVDKPDVISMDQHRRDSEDRAAKRLSNRNRSVEHSGTAERNRSAIGGTLRGTNGIRLGMLCVMLVMVLALMNKASNPNSWNWLFKYDNVVLDQNQQGPIENLESPIKDESSSGDKVSATPRKERSVDQSTVPSGASNLEQRFWRETLEKLDGQEQLRLFNLVESARQQISSSSGSTASLGPIVRIVKLRRQRFQNEMNDDQFVDQFIDQFEVNWTQSILPAFEAILNDQPNKALITEPIKILPQTLRAASQELIMDKTPVDRVKESYAWFASWAEVYDQPFYLNSELQSDSETNLEQTEPRTEESATVTQLISQPEAWRGKFLRLSGTAMRVERVNASRNALGIDRYYVIWIKPDHPSSFPYCVYSLAAPESLMGQPNEKMREVNQPVTTVARFFKNRLFNAGTQGQAAVAPVLMTTSITIPLTPTKVASEKFVMPGNNTVLLILGLVAGLACLIAFSVYKNTLSGRVRALPKSERMQSEFQDLQQDERVETTIEKLQRLGQRGQRGQRDD